MAEAAPRAFKIAISGKSGCGNTTVSSLVAKKLNCRFINFTFRNLAKEKGVSFEEVIKLAEEDSAWDREVDRRQVEIARSENSGCVLGSRLAIWLLPEADLKVYLKAESRVRAARIALREGGDIDEVDAFTRERDRRDAARYKKLYGIDTDDLSCADLVIDSGEFTPEEIVSKIIAALDKR